MLAFSFGPTPGYLGVGKSDGSAVFLAVVRVVDAQGLLGKIGDGDRSGMVRAIIFLDLYVQTRSTIGPIGVKCQSYVIRLAGPNWSDPCVRRAFHLHHIMIQDNQNMHLESLNLKPRFGLFGPSKTVLNCDDCCAMLIFPGMAFLERPLMWNSFRTPSIRWAMSS
jgi:hypothetical protein